MMLDMLTDSQPAQEHVWGVDTLDPLEQLDYVQDLWQTAIKRTTPQHPLLLLYAPSAERITLRCLQWLSRIGQRAKLAVFFYGQESMPALPPEIESTNSLLLVHRASRFVNLTELIRMHKKNRRIRIVLTAPVSERHAFHDLHIKSVAEMPTEEPAYCQKKAAEIIATHLGSARQVPQELDMLLQILVETGIAGVELPVGLLADFMHLDTPQLVQILENKMVAPFITLRPGVTPAKSLVCFMGQWLALEMSLKAKIGYYPLLISIIEFLNPDEPTHQLFLLNFLIALRVQAKPQEVIRFCQFHRQKIDACRAKTVPTRKNIWDALLVCHCQKTIRQLILKFRNTLKAPAKDDEMIAFDF